MNINPIMEELIDNTFLALQEVYKTTPKTHINEQELRTVFVKQFNKIANENNLYQSVSDEFDMTIFDQMGNRVCLIEFKAHNVDESNFRKDFVKLENIEKEECKDAYFVLLLEVCNKETIKSIHDKLSTFPLGKAHFKCFSFADNEYFGDITSEIMKYKE